MQRVFHKVIVVTTHLCHSTGIAAVCGAGRAIYRHSKGCRVGFAVLLCEELDLSALKAHRQGRRLACSKGLFRAIIDLIGIGPAFTDIIQAIQTKGVNIPWIGIVGREILVCTGDEIQRTGITCVRHTAAIGSGHTQGGQLHQLTPASFHGGTVTFKIIAIQPILRQCSCHTAGSIFHAHKLRTLIGHSLEHNGRIDRIGLSADGDRLAKDILRRQGAGIGIGCITVAFESQGARLGDGAKLNIDIIQLEYHQGVKPSLICAPNIIIPINIRHQEHRYQIALNRINLIFFYVLIEIYK